MNIHYFVVTLKICCFGFEKFYKVLVSGDTQETAARKAMFKECHSATEEDCKNCMTQSVSDADDTFLNSVVKIVPVDAADVEAVKKYFM